MRIESAKPEIFTSASIIRDVCRNAALILKPDKRRCVRETRKGKSEHPSWSEGEGGAGQRARTGILDT